MLTSRGRLRVFDSLGQPVNLVLHKDVKQRNRVMLAYVEYGTPDIDLMNNYVLSCTVCEVEFREKVMDFVARIRTRWIMVAFVTWGNQDKDKDQVDNGSFCCLGYPG